MDDQRRLRELEEKYKQACLDRDLAIDRGYNVCTEIIEQGLVGYLCGYNKLLLQAIIKSWKDRHDPEGFWFK